MKKRGIGISCNTHPAGLKGGGDPSQAQIRLKPDGTLDLLVGAVDIGQGSKTILRQIAADELGVPLEAITVNNFDTDIGPMCTGTFASRVTFMDGNAVIRAAADFKKKIREWAAEAMEANPEDIEMADNKVFVKGVPAKAKTMAEVGGAVNWGGQYIVGTGAFIPGAGQGFDPATGKMTAIASLAFGACVAEVEVDTETGVVDVLKLVQVYEVGKAINPLLCRGQINGGAMMGIGFALTEDFAPYYPKMDHATEGLADYIIATRRGYAQGNGLGHRGSPPSQRTPGREGVFGNDRQRRAAGHSFGDPQRHRRLDHRLPGHAGEDPLGALEKK